MAYPLLGTRFVLDEEKILQEGKYNLEKIYEFIDALAKECDLVKLNKNTYLCKGNKEDLARLGVFTHSNLVKYEWFTLNLKKWNWLSEKDGTIDLIARHKARNEGVWA